MVSRHSSMTGMSFYAALSAVALALTALVAAWSRTERSFYSQISQPSSKTPPGSNKKLIANMLAQNRPFVQADASWHSLGMDEGFIETMQHSMFDGSYSDSHSNADIGGEFMLARMGSSHVIEDTWHIPTNDIAIYDRMGHNYFSFFRGGIDDMAMGCGMLDHCDQLVITGTMNPLCKNMGVDWAPTPEKDAFTVSTAQRASIRHRLFRELPEYQPENTTRVTSTLIQCLKRLNVSWNRCSSIDRLSIPQERISFTSRESYALGFSMTSGDFDGDAANDTDSIGARFGTSMTVVDMNQDGVDDLAISAPMYRAHNPRKPRFDDDQFLVLGTTLYGLDVNGDGFKDLIVGSPMLLLCLELISKSPQNQEQWSHMDIFLVFSKAYYKVYPVKCSDYAQFGSNVRVVNNGVVAVGAPSQTSDLSSRRFMNLPGILISHLDIGYQAGIVHVLDLSALFGDKVLHRDVLPIAELHGSGSLGHFGAVIEMDVNHQGIFIAEHMVEAETGKLRWIPLSGLTGRLSVSDVGSYSACWTTDLPRMQFGRSFVSLHGIGLVISSTNAAFTKSHDNISAPNFSHGFGDGAVHILFDDHFG
ncbi:hypothetical protein BSLG_001143 [Batrachochytrium salamandrivorans]|nr:hypothetical protein BSLG_001143 [Batrachochytrium salamandrivorans]